MTRFFIGTAGWTLPAPSRDRFAAGVSQLHRYATRLNAVEINSSFHRPHRRITYERWAVSVPPGFRFSVKLPKSISHQKRLIAIEDEVARFAGEIAGLGERLGLVLLQLPPRFAVSVEAMAALEKLCDALPAPLAFEPRHPSWFAPDIDSALAALGIARIAADPAIVPAAAEPGGDRRCLYLRLHGSPRVYWSGYEPAALLAMKARIQAHAGDAWCIFDNTAGGHAAANALDLADMMKGVVAGPTGIEPVFAT